MKRHTVPWRKLAVLIPAALLGAAGGYFFMWALDPYGMTVLLPSLACLILSFWLQAILHEGGHLVCGLLSGYRFLSFRVGSFTLLRQNGRLVLRRFYLPGTGGQCLLEPPDGDEVPFRLYNLGGGLANLLSALAAALTAFLLPFPWPVFLLIFAAAGLFLGAVNLIPLSMDGVANDGFNLHLLSRSPQARRTFALQLRCHALLQRGIPLRDQPARWFQLPQDLEPQDPFTAAALSFLPSRLMDQGDLSGAEAAFRTLLDVPSGLLDIQRWDLTVDLLSCSLLLGRSQEELAPLRTPALLHYCKATRKFTPLHQPHGVPLGSAGPAGPGGRPAVLASVPALCAPLALSRHPGHGPPPDGAWPPARPGAGVSPASPLTTPTFSEYFFHFRSVYVFFCNIL